MINTELSSWLAYIAELHQKRIDLGLDRVACVADQLNVRHFDCPVIVVGGTNGKGSTVTCLEQIYLAAGFKTGLYTSPHLLRFNERIKINHQEISDTALIHAFERIEHARENISLSFFEFTTLAALYLFQQATLDVLILEIGLGGRLDAVNIVENDVAVVTTIDLDHMDFLGNTREAIAFEKASIARKNKPFVCGDEYPPTTLFETVSKNQACLFQIKKDFDYQVLKNTMIYSGQHIHLNVSPLPTIKAQNVATSLMAIECLQKKLPVSLSAILQGIQNTVLPGRFEMISSPMPCIMDVAHNPQAAMWLSEQYRQLSSVSKSAALVGMLKDKAMTETVAPLLPLIQDWYVTALSGERGSDGKQIAEFLKANGVKNCYTFGSVDAALTEMNTAYCQHQWNRALIFGSFHTISEAKNWFYCHYKENTNGR